MAQVTTIRLVDDLDGTVADERVEFGIDGCTYEIDLTSTHAQALRAALTDYVAAGRLVPSPGAAAAAGHRPGQSATTRDRGCNRAVRAWARNRGIPVSDRGRIADAVLEAFHSAVQNRDPRRSVSPPPPPVSYHLTTQE